MNPVDSPDPDLPVVLFVDDEEALRRQAVRILRGRFEVLGAGSAEEATDLMEGREAPVDVLLMDINLPDGWGSLVAQRLRSIQPDLAVVYTTGYAAEDPVLAGGLNDAAFVLTKPYTTAQLIGILERAVETGGPRKA